MFENVTSYEIEPNEIFEIGETSDATLVLQQYLTPVIIVVGLFCNILALTILIRCRLWLRNEGFLILTAIFISYIVEFTIVVFPHWIFLLRSPYYIPLYSLALCKLWLMVPSVTISLYRWFFAALLLNVYLRIHLFSSDDRMSTCKKIAGKYCTLFSSKIVLISVFVASIFGNLWLICNTKYIVYDSKIQHCFYDPAWHHKNYRLVIVWYFLAQHLPIFILTPVLGALIIWKKRRNSAAVAFNQLEKADNVDYTAEMTTASLYAVLVVFIMALPCDAVVVLVEVLFEPMLLAAWRVTVLISDIQKILLPVLYMAVITKIREFIKSALTQRCDFRDFFKRNLCLSQATDDAILLEETNQDPSSPAV